MWLDRSVGEARCGRCLRSPRSDVVRGERGLIADVEYAPADDRVRPARKTLIWDPEPASLLIAGRHGRSEAHHVVFTQNIEIAVRIRQRALPHAAVAPLQPARPEFQAREDRVVEAVQVAVDEDDTAMMVLHFACEIDLLRRDLAILRRQPE